MWFNSSMIETRTGHYEPLLHTNPWDVAPAPDPATRIEGIPAPDEIEVFEISPVDPVILARIKAHHAAGTDRSALRKSLVKFSPDDQAEAIVRAIAEVYES